MTTEETAAQICEFAVAKLDVKPGDVVAVKGKGLDPESMYYVQQGLDDFVATRDLSFTFLVVHDTFDMTVIHTLTPEEVEAAGVGGWPHEETP